MSLLSGGYSTADIGLRRTFKSVATLFLLTNTVAGIAGLTDSIAHGKTSLNYYQDLRDSVSLSTARTDLPKFVFANLAMGVGMRTGEMLGDVMKAYGETRHQMNLNASLP